MKTPRNSDGKRIHTLKYLAKRNASIETERTLPLTTQMSSNRKENLSVIQGAFFAKHKHADCLLLNNFEKKPPN